MSLGLHKGSKLLIVMAAALVLLLVAACGSDDLPRDGGWFSYAALGQSNNDTGIRTSGRGEASAVPDLAIVNLGVEAFADTASQARAKAAAAIGETLAVLKAQGLADRDIQTSFFNIRPRYNTVEVTKCSDAESGATTSEPAIGAPARDPEELKGTQCSVEFERVLEGYEVNNRLTVKIRELDSVGPVIDGVTEVAGDLTRVDGISFTIEDTGALQDEAREAAIADLLRKANLVASAAGVQLGGLVRLSESGGGFPEPIFRAEAAFASPASDGATSISAGELDVVVTVQGVFDIVGGNN